MIYKLELTVKEGYDEFWEGVNKSKQPEVEVMELIKVGLETVGMTEGEDYDIKLVNSEKE